METTTLQSVTLALTEARRRRVQELERHEKALVDIDAQVQELEAARGVLSAGLDADRIARGREVLEIRGKVTAGERARVVEDACADLAKGCGGLRYDYFGTKNYDRWNDQRCDCKYGYGPRHGSIVFSVGLNRRFCARWAAEELTPEDVDAGLYLLTNLVAIQEAEERAA